MTCTLRLSFLVLAILPLLPQAAAADPPPDPSPVVSPTVSATPSAGRGRTPRAALQQWIDLERAGRHEEAATHLDLPPSLVARGPALSRSLKAVLDRHLWFDMSAVSDAPDGTVEEGLPADVESLGTVPGPGAPESVLLVRDAAGDWRFSRGTVERIDAWHAMMPGRWVAEWIPAPLTRPGPKELLWWQWLALPLLALVAYIGGRAAARMTTMTLGAMVRRTKGTWDDALLPRARAPLAIAWAVGFVWALVPLLELYPPAQAFVHSLLWTLLYAAAFLLALRAVDIAGERAAAAPWAVERKLSGSLVPLATRSGKVLVAAIGLIAILSTLGYPVASLLAGLGIGGLAVALAAQKTVENVFGAFSIGVDQPIREGDFVKVEDFVGTVEKIGLRSTRIRTLDRTLIAIPNGRLSDMRLETFAARDRIRLYCTIGLVYDTTAAQMREILAALEATLRAHPKIWPEAVVVRFCAFGSSSLDVEVMAWFETSDWNEFTSIRQEMFLSFMRTVEQAGSSFAFPTRTLHVHEAKAAPAATMRS